MHRKTLDEWFMRTILCFLLASTCICTSWSVSLVYNMRIRRSFAIPQFLQKDRTFLWLLSAVPVVYGRKRHIIVPDLKQNFHEKTFLGGSLFNIRCLAPRHWWAELTTGVERQTSKAHGTQEYDVSRTGWDDIVLSAGKNFLFGKKGQVGLFGIAGFPTRTKVTLADTEDTLVGTRFFGLGAGAEGSYSFIATPKRTLTGIVQARLVHFFNRKWFPILPCSAQIQPGNLTDVFVLLQYREKKNVFEAGYNATFFTQQAVHLASGTVDSPNLTRNSSYASFSRLFLKSWLLKKPGVIGIGFNIARTNIFDTKIADVWLNFSLLF